MAVVRWRARRPARDLERGQPRRGALDTVGVGLVDAGLRPAAGAVRRAERIECCGQSLGLELLVRQQALREPLQRQPVQGSQHRRRLASDRPAGHRACACLSGMSRPGAARQDATRWRTSGPTPRATDDDDGRALLGDPSPSSAQLGVVARAVVGTSAGRDSGESVQARIEGRRDAGGAVSACGRCTQPPAGALGRSLPPRRERSCPGRARPSWRRSPAAATAATEGVVDARPRLSAHVGSRGWRADATLRRAETRGAVAARPGGVP